LLNAVRFWWDPCVCFIINWQMSGLIASRAVNFSLHQNDQNGSGAHTASCSVSTVGSAGAWSWLLKSVECRCQDCSTFMVCAGTTLNFLPISIIARQQIAFSVKSKPWNKVLFLKLVFPQLVSKFPAFYVPSWFNTMFTRFRQLPLSWARWIYSTPYLPVSLRFSLILFSYRHLDLTSSLFLSGCPQLKIPIDLFPFLRVAHNDNRNILVWCWISLKR
jgi:hypothetical protein